MENVYERFQTGACDRHFSDENPFSTGASSVRPVMARHVLQSPGSMQAILHRECARCERSGTSFCLIVIDPGKVKKSSGLAAAGLENGLGEILIDEVRQSDEIGFLDENRLCAVLPYTTPEGAGQFIDRLSERFAAIGANAFIKLYVYPHVRGALPEMPVEDRKPKRPAKAARTSVPVTGVEELLVRPSPWWKRMTDVAVSAIAIGLLWPLFLLIAAAIKLTSPGPVIFPQWRSGIGGKPFRIFKFRTMVPNADQAKHKLMSRNEQDGPAFKMERDPRITRFGRILRKTSLDELPQFFNVLLGDMSLVGPRPLPIEEAKACDVWHHRRLDVVPGLTCTWQITGRGTVSFADWVRMDREYIRTRTLLRDVKLIMLTVPAILSRRGAK